MSKRHTLSRGGIYPSGPLRSITPYRGGGGGFVYGANEPGRERGKKSLNLIQLSRDFEGKKEEGRCGRK